MDRTIEIEIREQSGKEPTLFGTMIQEGRASVGGLRELFAPGAIEWPSEGVGIMTEHRGAIEVRGQVIRHRDGKLTLTARATDKIRKAVADGKRFMSVEFQALKERTTAGGIREIERALVSNAALVRQPEYGQTAAEVRSQAADIKRRAGVWL